MGRCHDLRTFLRNCSTLSIKLVFCTFHYHRILSAFVLQSDYLSKLRGTSNICEWKRPRGWAAHSQRYLPKKMSKLWGRYGQGLLTSPQMYDGSDSNILNRSARLGLDVRNGSKPLFRNSGNRPKADPRVRRQFDDIRKLFSSKVRIFSNTLGCATVTVRTSTCQSFPLISETLGLDRE